MMTTKSVVLVGLLLFATHGCGQADAGEPAVERSTAGLGAKTGAGAAAKRAILPRVADDRAGADEQAADPADGTCNCHDPTPPADDVVEQVAIGSAPTRGPATAPITVVVFGDFQCPYCAKLAREIEVLERELGDDLRVVYKNRPLPMHDKARAAARAALAADEQGAFWAFHDGLFDGGALDRASLETRAADLGLDVDRFREAMGSSRVEARIHEDEREAGRLDVKGTPTMFVNGRRVTGAQPIETLRALVQKVR